MVRFLGILVSPDNTKLYLVTVRIPSKLLLITQSEQELMHQGNLRDLLNKKGGNLPPSLRLKLAKDAATGM